MPIKNYCDNYADKFIINSGETGASVFDDVTIGGAATVAETLAVTGVTTATGGVVGDITGDITGDVTGDLVKTLATEAGTGITTGTGTIYESSAYKDGGIFRSTILLDLTGLRSTAAGDIIGVDGTALDCHLGQITAARSGTILGIRFTCLETPAGGDPDVDFYSADESTGSEDDAISGLTNGTQLINHGDWTEGQVAVATAIPAANQYLYAVAGATTDADYTAGQFLIEFFGS